MNSKEFILYIRFEKRYSDNTILAYRNDLDQFYNFIKDRYNIINIKDVDYSIIRSWLVFLMENSISARSINRKLTSLKSFYKFLVKEGEVEINPMNKVISPKTPKKIPQFVEKEKMDMLFKSIDFGEGFSAIRDRFILELFYATGMRLSELVNLKVSDINFSNSTIKVLGKRNKERLIPYNVVIKSLIQEYLTEKGRIFNKPEEEEEYLFVTDKGDQIYHKLVYRIVSYYLGLVTSLNKKSPHILRHTFATHMLNNGADLNAIKELLGHANLSATQVYTHNSIDKLKSIYKQAHPKA